MKKLYPKKWIIIFEFDNWCVRYFQHIPWDTIWLIIYIENWKYNIENNPKLSNIKINNIINKYLCKYI